jgi:hypothetical protein
MFILPRKYISKNNIDLKPYIKHLKDNYSIISKFIIEKLINNEEEIESNWAIIQYILEN